MKRFLFSMQKLLDARIAWEKGRQMTLAKINKRLALMKKERREFSRVRAAEVVDIIKTQKLSGAGWQVASLVSYLDALDSRIQMCETDLQGVTVEREKARAELSAAVKERKVLEKLSEKERQSWLIDCKRLEQKSIDESASAGFFRRIHAV
jgi:flagellar export protein FliJ